MAGRRTMLRNWVDRLSLDMKAGDIPANAISSVLLALCDGLILHSSADPSAFRWSNIRLAVDVLLDGLNVKTTQTSRPVEPPAFRPASKRGVGFEISFAAAWAPADPDGN
jgi:hypothetical protein